MGETREPAKGHWSVFEGDRYVAGLTDTLGHGEDINRELVWPVSLRVHYIRDGVMESRDVEIAEDFTVTVRKHDRASIAPDG